MNPSTLTTGTATSVPRNSLGDRAAISSRITSTPITSSPWMAPLTQTTGPGSRPCTTRTGRLTSPPVTSRVIGSSTSRAAPARTRTLPMAKDSLAMALHAPVAPPYDALGPASEVGLLGVDEEPLAQGFPADEQPEAHLVAAAERHLGRDHPLADPQREQDDVPLLDVPRRAPHPAHVVDRELGGDRVLGSLLPRVDREPHPWVPVPLELLEIERVQRRGPRAGVELGLDPADAELGQTHP